MPDSENSSQPDPVSTGVTFHDHVDETVVIAESLAETAQVTEELTKPNIAIVPAVVKNSLGPGTRTVMRGEGGKFVKNTQKQLQKDVTVAAQIESEIQRLLSEPATDKEGKPILKKGKPVPKHLAAVEHLLEMITNLKEEKAIGAAGKALTDILTRAIGRPAESPKARSEMITHGIKTVFVAIPVGVKEAPPTPEKEKPKQPSFAEPSTLDAEIVQQNAAPKAPRGRPKVIEAELITEDVHSK